ncbi:hypothetical protein GW17_00008478 [Ensete ventricosum]|nr:hypothetical protein GW17_00008478 [Ensete ventricosum]
MSKHQTKINPQIPPCVNQTTPDDREKGGRVAMKTNLFRHDRTSDEGMDTAAPAAKRGAQPTKLRVRLISSVVVSPPFLRHGGNATKKTIAETESFGPTFLSIHGVLHWFAFIQALQSSSDLSVLADDAPGVVPVQATSERREEFRQVCGAVDGLGGTERRVGEGEVHESCPHADRWTVKPWPVAGGGTSSPSLQGSL